MPKKINGVKSSFFAGAMPNVCARSKSISNALSTVDLPPLFGPVMIALYDDPHKLDNPI